MTVPTHLLDHVNNLDPLPMTAQRLLEALSNENVTIKEIAEIVEYDQAISANVVRIANSSLYAALSEVDSVQQALARLGLSTIVTTVFTHHLAEIAIDAPIYDISENELWLHGALASIAASEIRLRSSRSDIPPTVSLAALLHDIGKLIISRYHGDKAAVIQNLCKEGSMSFLEAETKVIGCNHAQVGAAMSEKWGFPEEITDAIRDHHTVPVRHASPTTDATQLANLVAKNLGVGYGVEGMNFRVDLGAAGRLGLDTGSFAEICGQTFYRMAGLLEAYGLGA